MDETETRAADRPQGPIARVEILFGHFTPVSGDQSAGAMRLQVGARNILVRAMPFIARVGEQPVRSLIVGLGGGGFSGMLERTPRDGDRLYVRYADSDEVSTGVVYQGPGIA